MIVAKSAAQQAAGALGVDLYATQDEISAAYRDKAREAHPDGGGDPAAFVALGRAKDALLSWQRLQGIGEACLTCGGDGSVAAMRSFRLCRVTCPDCGGSGLRV